MARFFQLRNHSREQMLTASDGALIADGKGIHASASNPNLAAQAGHAPELDPSVGRVSSWAVDFERLLHDELGLACFTEFLKKEFSDENIMFWIACERMSKITDQKELRQMAQDIYDNHLGPKAYNQVNLDASTRSMVEGALKNPTPEMFRAQQQQIFKLMKFDSYSRFLKSKLYQDCVLAEMGGLPLPISLEHTPTNHPTDHTATSHAVGGGIAGVGGGMVHDGLASGSGGIPHGGGEETNGGVSMEGTVKDQMNRKKSNKKDQQRQKLSVASEDEEKRRTSILPWRNKNKKSKDGDKHLNSSGNEDTSISSRHSSVTSSDFRPAGEKFVDMNNCYHMIFPNNEILTMTPEPQQTVQDVLNPLLKERGLCLQNVEIFLNDTKESVESLKHKLINLTQMTTAMVGRQIVVERRVVFKIELPNKRVIGVKSKLTKKIIEVLRPVTYKYSLQLDALVVHLSESPVPLDLDITVASLDGQRILIETLEQYSAGSYAVSGRASVGATTTNNNAATKPDNRAPSVDSFLKEDQVLRANPSQGQRDKLKTQLSMPAMSLSSFQPPTGDTMRDKRAMSGSIPTTPPEVKNLPPTSGRTEGRRGGNLRVTGNDTEDLIAMVSKVQSKRLDDQRGLTLRNLELPDFLKITQAPTSTSSSKPTDSRPKSALGLPINAAMLDASRRLQQDGQLKAADIDALNLRPKSTPPRQVALRQEDGFTDGILPTNAQAEQLFMGGSPRTPTVRFDDMVVKSTYKDTAWDQRAYINYPQQSPTEGSFQTGMSKFFSPEDKLSPRAFGGSRLGGNDSTDHGLNTTAYSLEFNSSFGSTDQPNLDTTLTSTSSEPQLPLPPTPDLDTTIKADLPNYTPPPALGQTPVTHRGGSGYPSKTSLIVPDIRKKPIVHPFTAGSTLPGHDLETASKLIIKSNPYAINGYPPSSMAVASQLSSSNNNSTKLSSTSKAPDIQAESGNCYSNYGPFPTISNGSFYDGLDDTDANSKPGMAPQPDVTQVCAKERIIKPPPAYTSSMTTKPAKAAYSSSEDLRGAAPTLRHQGKAQGVGQGSGWGVHVTSTSQGNTAKTYTSRSGSQQAAPSVVNVPPKSVPHGVQVAPTTTPSGTFAPRMQHAPYTGAPRMSTGGVPRLSASGTHGGQGVTHGAAPRGADGRLMPSTTKDQKIAAGASPDFQGKESVVFSKDGRKVRATFV